MSLGTNLPDELKRKIEAMKAGRIPEPTRAPIETPFTKQSKGK